MIIVDAGETTIDVSAYSQNIKGSFEEIAAPHCESTMVPLFRHFRLSFKLQAISKGRFSSASTRDSSSTVYSLL